MILHTFQKTEAPSRAILGFHGWTGDEFSMEPIAKSVGADSAKWFMPRAPYDADTGDGYTWFSGSDEVGWKYDKTIEMIPELMGKISMEGFSPEQTFIVGFSMGAGLAILTASKLPYTIGGIVPIAGFVKNPNHLTSNMTEASLNTPILMMQGKQDEIVTTESAEKTIELLKSLGYSVQYETYDAGHKVPREAMPIIRKFIEKEI